MTDTIEHLDQAQTQEQRRELPANDGYMLFCFLLKQLKEQGLTELSWTKAFLSAEHFANLLLSLPEEGIDDEFEDLKKEAKGGNDAMIISVLAACLICDQRGSLPASVWQFLATHIFARWDEHPLLEPMLEAAARKEETRWMEGKKTDLLTCEMNETHLDGARAVVFDIVENCMGLTPESIEKILLPLMALKGKYGPDVDEQINRLQEKLNEKTTTQATTQVNVQAGGANFQNVEHYH